MQKKFQKKDKVKYGSLEGEVININKKIKTIECKFFEDYKEICILFDYDGDIIPCGKYIENPKLEILK
jgi:hypothetical protein